MAPTPAKKAPAKKVAAAPAKTAGKAAARKSAPTKAATKPRPPRSRPRARQRRRLPRRRRRPARPPTEGRSGEGGEGARQGCAGQAPPAKSATAKRTAAKTAAAPARARKEVAAKSSSHFDATFLASQRKLLIEERANLLGQAQRLEAEAAELMEDLDPGDVQFDDESGEGDTLVVERERDLALSAQARQTVSDIDAALARIDERDVRPLGGVGASDPQGAPEGDPVGDRTGRGEGRRARLPPVSSPASRSLTLVSVGVAALVVLARPAHQDVGRAPPQRRAHVDVIGRCASTSRSTAAWPSARAEGSGPFIGVVALVVIVVLLVSLRRTGSMLSAVGIGLVIGGAIGNVADRLFRAGDGFLGARWSTSSTCSGGRCSTWPTWPSWSAG